MKLINQGEREILFRAESKKDGKVIPAGVIRPGKGIEVDDATGEKLKRLYPRELVTFEDVVQKFESTTAEAVTAAEEALKPEEPTEIPLQAPGTPSGETPAAETPADNAGGKPEEVEDAPKAGGIGSFFKRSS